MKNQRTSGMTRRDFLRGTLASLAYASLGSTLLGCATSGKQGGLFGSYGSLKSSREVTREFENYKVKDNHNYFVAGDGDGILALDNQYILDSGFWKPFDPQDGKLKDLVGKMRDASENIPYGANVLDGDGNEIGDWYSVANGTIIKLKNGRTFRIDTPKMGRSGGGGKSKGGSGEGGSSG